MALVGNQDFRNSARISNLPGAIADGQPVTYEQLATAIPTLAPIPTALTTAVQTAFPAMGTAQVEAIAIAVRYSDLRSTLGYQDIINLLIRPGNDIWDLRNFYNQFTDTTGTIPVTTNGQPVRRVKEWIGGNDLILDTAYNPLTSDSVNGALFPATKAVANFTRRTDISFVIMAVRQTIPPTGTTPIASPFLLGDATNLDFHPRHLPGVRLFSESNASPIALGSIWLNNIATPNAERDMPAGPLVITCKPTAPVAANSIAKDRIYMDGAEGGHYFEGNARFYLISSENFNSVEIDALNKFALYYSGIAPNDAIAQGPPGPAQDLASPGPIGTVTPSTAKFTFVSGSRSLASETPLANNTTLTRAIHMGQIWLINGGTIKLPLDANWQIGDEVHLVVSGTNQTNIDGNGANIKLGPFGAATGISIAGVEGQRASFTKIGSNNVACDFAFHYLSGLIDTTALTSPSAGDALRWDPVAGKWNNLPAPFSIEDNINRAFLLPGSGSTSTQIGIPTTIVGTTANPQPTSTSFYNRVNRFTVTSSATAGSLASIRVAVAKLWRGNAVGLGGFKIEIPFGGATLVSGNRAFVGISSAPSSATNVDPLTDAGNSKIGLACNSNTGTWTLIHNLSGTAPTQVPLTPANTPIDVTTWYELTLECLPNASSISWTLKNRSNNTTQTGILSTNIPSNTTYLNLYTWICNNATATAAALTYGRIGMEWRE